jgi:DNA polymerase
MNILTIDFETYYSTDFSLTRLTTEEYVRDDRFEVIGVAVGLNGDAPEWFSGTHEQTKEWLNKFDWCNHFALAHNAMFDSAILSWVFGIKPMAWLDTLGMARATDGLEAGNSLAKLATRYNLGVKGTEVVDAKDRRRHDFRPEWLAQYGEYCKNDVTLTYDLFNILVQRFSKHELKLIDLTIKMFSEPVLRLETPMLEQHLMQVKTRKEKLLDACISDKDTLMSNPKLAELLVSLGVEPPMKISPANGKETYAFAKSD